MLPSENLVNRNHAWRFKFAISAIVIAFLLGVTIRKLVDFQIHLEKENVENQVQNFRLGLSEAWISRNIAHKNTNISTFENTNPMLLISDVPKNYIGERKETPENEKAVWYYNTNSNRLIYILNNGESIQYKLVKKIQPANRTGVPNGGLDLVPALER